MIARFRPRRRSGSLKRLTYAGHESLYCLGQGYVMAIDDCKQCAGDAHVIRVSARGDVRRNADAL
jgi:hypothetical protein